MIAIAFMLRKRFSLSQSKVKSRFVFRLPEHKTESNESGKSFRDRAALPLLERLADALRMRGYFVSTPKRGKACDGTFQVTFSSVMVIVILLVERPNEIEEFTLLSWPFQTLSQRLSRSVATPDDFAEWAKLCSDINEVLANSLGAEHLRWSPANPHISQISG
jgi:hypothetical protein